jgi:hypothetical protein
LKDEKRDGRKEERQARKKGHTWDKDLFHFSNFWLWRYASGKRK